MLVIVMYALALLAAYSEPHCDSGATRLRDKEAWESMCSVSGQTERLW